MVCVSSKTIFFFVFRLVCLRKSSIVLSHSHTPVNTATALHWVATSKVSDASLSASNGKQWNCQTFLSLLNDAISWANPSTQATNIDADYLKWLNRFFSQANGWMAVKNNCSLLEFRKQISILFLLFGHLSQHLGIFHNIWEFFVDKYDFVFFIFIDIVVYMAYIVIYGRSLFPYFVRLPRSLRLLRCDPSNWFSSTLASFECTQHTIPWHGINSIPKRRKVCRMDLNSCAVAVVKGRQMRSIA